MIRLVVPLALCLLVGIPPAEAQSPGKAPVGPSRERLMQQAQFIFHGRLETLRASNLKVLVPSERTALVRVLKVLESPPILSDFAGREITVELQQPGRLTTRQEAIFYTRGWLYGESLAVKEIAHRPVPGNLAAEQQEIQATREKLEDRNLRNRLAASVLVVTGKVSDTRPAPDDVRGAGGTEHDPDWWEAVIQIDAVERGRLTERSLTILFPKSRDVMWFRSPKLEPSQVGTWLLRKKKLPEFGTKQREYYTALDAMDFQPLQELNRIRALIQTIR